MSENHEFHLVDKDEDAFVIWRSFLRAVELRDFSLIEYWYARIVIHRHTFAPDIVLGTIDG